jgi:hypothetical protein
MHIQSTINVLFIHCCRKVLKVVSYISFSRHCTNQGTRFKACYNSMFSEWDITRSWSAGKVTHKKWYRHTQIYVLCRGPMMVYTWITHSRFDTQNGSLTWEGCLLTKMTTCQNNYLENEPTCRLPQELSGTSKTAHSLNYLEKQYTSLIFEGI